MYQSFGQSCRLNIQNFFAGVGHIVVVGNEGMRVYCTLELKGMLLKRQLGIDNTCMTIALRSLEG